MTKEELRKSLDFVNEERERLQKENELYKTSLDESQEVVLDYKNKIEKAIKLIKDNYLYYEDRLEDSIVKERYKKYIQILLNILNGRSDE